MVHLGCILILFVFPLIDGIDGENLPDHFLHIMERLTDLENRLHLQEEKNVDLEKRLSDQEKLNAIQMEIIQELATCDCTSKEKETLLSNRNRNFSSAEPYSSNIESTNTDGSFHVNKTKRNNARKEVLLHDDLKGLSSSPGLIEFNRKNKRETSVVPAFHAYMSTPETDPGPHHTFIFDRVVTNIGGNYNHHTGIFTATESGVYVFSWTVFCYDERLHELEKRLHVQEQKNVHLEKRLSDQEKLNAIQTELIQELTSCDCKFKEKDTVLSHDDGNHSTEDPYSGKIESVNTDGTFHENTTRRKSVSKEDLLNDDFNGSSSPGQIEYNRKNIREVAVGPAFHAYMTDSEADPGHHHTFIFDRTVTNIGGNYNHHTVRLLS
uniref:Uncharacterized protein LOC111116241 n=1 Tax=Crassostrea virginica TaxID=6565 RepID=A0A8B8C736_CRAVI|nr:uncharacterized protein LOC111116241 [Crassostrea virginica]